MVATRADARIGEIPQAELAAAGSTSGVSRLRVDALEARFHTARRLLTKRLERDDRRQRVAPPHPVPAAHAATPAA
jgi:hypothetical protein